MLKHPLPVHDDGGQVEDSADDVSTTHDAGHLQGIQLKGAFSTYSGLGSSSYVKHAIITSQYDKRATHRLRVDWVYGKQETSDEAWSSLAEHQRHGQVHDETRD